MATVAASPLTLFSNVRDVAVCTADRSSDRLEVTVFENRSFSPPKGCGEVVLTLAVHELLVLLLVVFLLAWSAAGGWLALLLRTNFVTHLVVIPLLLSNKQFGGKLAILLRRLLLPLL